MGQVSEIHLQNRKNRNKSRDTKNECDTKADTMGQVLHQSPERDSLSPVHLNHHLEGIFRGETRCHPLKIGGHKDLDGTDDCGWSTLAAVRLRCFLLPKAEARPNALQRVHRGQLLNCWALCWALRSALGWDFCWAFHVWLLRLLLRVFDVWLLRVTCGKSNVDEVLVEPAVEAGAVACLLHERSQPRRQPPLAGERAALWEYGVEQQNDAEGAERSRAAGDADG